MRKVIVLYTCVLVSLAAVLRDETSNLCQEKRPKPSMWCPISLTIAIDFSTRMGAEQNVANLVYSIVADMLPMYIFESSSLMVSLIGFGQTPNYTVDMTPFYQDYNNICEDILEEEEDSRINRNDASLRFVYKDYYFNITQKLPLKSKKVFIVFTAINDENDVKATQPFADKLRSDYGVSIIAVYLGSENGQHLLPIADKVWATNSYRIPVAIVHDVVIASCLNATAPTTAKPVTQTTQTVSKTTPSPSNNLDGVPCATDIRGAWLDIAIVVEETEVTTNSKLRNEIVTLLKKYISNLTISSNINNASRISVINYSQSNYASVRHSFKDSQSEAVVTNVLNDLNKTPSKDSVGNIEAGLKQAQTEFNNNPSNRVKTIILVASTYEETPDPFLTAEMLKDDMIKIITVFIGETSGSPDTIDPLASPSLAFQANMTEDEMTHSIAIANCHCPGGWTQLNYSNSTHRGTPLGECFFAYDIWVLPDFVQCDGDGGLVTVTSESRLNFLQKSVIPEGLGSASAFSIGLSRATESDAWKWGTVDGPIDYIGYPRFEKTPERIDLYGYLMFDNGDWQLFSDDGYTDSRPYICQRKACDAQNYCSD